MLNALKIVIESVLLVKAQTLTPTENLNDFSKMTKHLLQIKYKDPAAFLVGAVLEDGLRKLAIKNAIRLKQQGNISSLNANLADKAIYSKSTRSKIQAWKKIRDSAAHGKFDEYDEKEVQSFFTWTKDFLEKHLS